MLRRNVLIFHLGALGDFILTWPLAMAAARLFPQSRIYYVTHAQKALLAEQVLGVEGVDIELAWHSLYSSSTALPERPARLLRESHLVISFLSTPDDAWTAHARDLAPAAQFLLLRPTPPADYPHHSAEHLLEQLAPTVALHEAMRQMLHVISEHGLSKPARSGGPIIIHPGSGSERKCWPAERFLQLIERLRDDRPGVRVLLGEVELETWPPSLIARFAGIAQVARPATYLDLYRELHSAAAYIGNDSGPSHLAGILGIPTLCLYGPTDPAVWHPLGPSVTTLRGQPLESLGVEQVYAAAARVPSTKTEGP